MWEYVRQIASALYHMETMRIMHRDLKPANIFIDSGGSLKVGDFGLGRQLSDQTAAAFSRVGTPLYMSPELLNGSGYDWKNDVWSMGCIAYELCTLRSPFKDKTEKLSLYDLFNRINAGEYDQIHDKYSMKLRNLINSMLRVNPEERASLQEVVAVCDSEHKREK